MMTPEKKFGKVSEQIPITYTMDAIVTGTSKVRLKPWCCGLFSIHGYLALILFTVKPILRHSFGRSWYMRLLHTPRTFFLLTTRLWKHNSCSGFIFILGKNLKAPSRAFVNSSLRPHAIKTSMKNFNGFSLPIAVLVFTCGRWRQGVLCVIQSLPHPDFGCVTRFAEWFVSGLLFSSTPPPSKISSTLAP